MPLSYNPNKIGWKNFLKKVSLLKNPKTIEPELTGEVMLDGFAKVEEQDMRVSKIYMNALDFTTVRKFGRDMWDPENTASRLKLGIMGMMWGAEIVVSRAVPPRTILFVGDELARVKAIGVIMTLGAKSPFSAEFLAFRAELSTARQDLTAVALRVDVLLKKMTTLVDKLDKQKR